MSLSERVWSLSSDSDTYKSKNVILATGAVPSVCIIWSSVVPFDVAIDKTKLEHYIDTKDTYAVFGSYIRQLLWFVFS